MTTTLTISAPLAMAAVPGLIAIGGVVVGIALNGWLTTGIEVARLNAANDDKTARWLWLRGYRKTPHAGPDITPELPAVDPHVTGELLAIDGVDTEADAPHEDTDRAGMWRVLLGLGSDLVDRVHDWLPDLLAQWRERNDVGTGEQFGAEDPFAVDSDQPNDYDPVTGQRVQVVYPTPEPERQYRKKPVVIDAMQWTGDNADLLRVFTDGRFTEVAPEDRTDDPDKDAAVLDDLHSTWVLMTRGDWVICGIKGEFYPCADAVFAETYEQAN